MFYYLSGLKVSFLFFKKNLSRVQVPEPRDSSSGQRVPSEELCHPRAHTSRTREQPAEEESRGEQNSIGMESEINFGNLNFFKQF